MGCGKCINGRIICDECDNGGMKYLCSFSSQQEYKKGQRMFNEVCQNGKKICIDCAMKENRREITECCNKIKKIFIITFSKLFGCFKKSSKAKKLIKEK